MVVTALPLYAALLMSLLGVVGAQDYDWSDPGNITMTAKTGGGQKVFAKLTEKESKVTITCSATTASDLKLVYSQFPAQGTNASESDLQVATGSGTDKEVKHTMDNIAKDKEGIYNCKYADNNNDVEQKMELYVYEKIVNATEEYKFHGNKKEDENQEANLNCTVKDRTVKSSKWSICRQYNATTKKCSEFKQIQDEDLKKQENKEVLNIKKFKRIHTGEYGVVHTFDIKDYKTATVGCKLPVKAGPFVLPNKKKSLDIYLGDKLEVKFKVFGYPIGKTEWLKDGKVIENATLYKMTWSAETQEAMLVKDITDDEDNCVYSLKVKSADSKYKDSSNASVVVRIRDSKEYLLPLAGLALEVFVVLLIIPIGHLCQARARRRRYQKWLKKKEQAKMVEIEKQAVVEEANAACRVMGTTVSEQVPATPKETTVTPTEKRSEISKASTIRSTSL